MNRASFLKSLGVGIAAAVITPKILIEATIPDSAKNKEYCLAWAKDLYAIHLKDLQMGVGHLRIWDHVIDREQEVYIITGIDSDNIELTAVDPNVDPNFMDVKKAIFNDFFVYGGSSYCIKS